MNGEKIKELDIQIILESTKSTMALQYFVLNMNITFQKENGAKLQEGNFFNFH